MGSGLRRNAQAGYWLYRSDALDTQAPRQGGGEKPKGRAWTGACLHTLYDREDVMFSAAPVSAASGAGRTGGREEHRAWDLAAPPRLLFLLFYSPLCPPAAVSWAQPHLGVCACIVGEAVGRWRLLHGGVSFFVLFVFSFFCAFTFSRFRASLVLSFLLSTPCELLL